MDKYKKFMYIGIFILLISLVSSAGTYAWFTWISPSNTSVTLSIGNLADVTFTSGPDINISNLAPVYNYTDGVSTTFTVRNTNSTDSLLYKVKLEITSIANELKDESFKYTLLKDNKVVKTGNLKDAINGNTLILNTSSLDKGSTSSPKISTFKLYFWIDGNMENNSNMMNKSLVGKIDVGVETNVIVSDNSTPSSGDSTFLNTSIARKNIKTLKYVDNLNIPEGATVVDVSKNGDNTIKMWYNEADANGNYDITIGSNNTIYANPSGSNLFSNLTNVTSIDLSNLNTSGIVGMNGMFENDKVLTNIVFGDNFDTSNATNMTAMFLNCSSLKALDLLMFDTSNVTVMGRMFQNCSSLTLLDLSSFNTAKLTDIGAMFTNCYNLKSVDLSSFDTSNVTSFWEAFFNCKSLIKLDLSNFDTSKVVNMEKMFIGCSSLVELNVSSFNTSNVTKFYDMFNGCSSLKKLDVSGFDTSKATTMGNMFSGCSSLESLDVSHFNTSNVQNMRYMFSSLKCDLNLSNFDTSKVEDLSFMFMYYGGEKLDLSSFDTSKVTGTNHMFASSSVKYIDLRNADFTNVSSYTDMFKGISKSTIIYLKDTTGNRNFMNTNFNNITATYIS